jgi:HAMP domain-containing protein
MKNKLKRRLAWMVGAIFVAWFVYGIASSFLGVTGAPFDWSNALLILTPLTALALLFAFLIGGDDETTGVIKRKLISLYVIAIAVLFWVISPIEDFFILNITGSEVAIDVLTYLLMALVLGGIGIAIFMMWFRPIDEFMRKYQSDIKGIDRAKVSEISKAASWFPVRTALTAAFMSTLGYVVGAATFYLVHSDIPVTLVVNNILIGIAIGPMVFSVIYFFSRSILEGVGSILYVFKDIAVPQRVIGVKGKILFFGIAPGIFFTITSATLFFNLIDGRMSLDLFYSGIAANFAFALLLMVIIGEGLIMSAVSALYEIKHGMELMQSGNWTHRISVRTGDEMEDVAYEFNKMADELEKRCK